MNSIRGVSNHWTGLLEDLTAVISLADEVTQVCKLHQKGYNNFVCVHVHVLLCHYTAHAAQRGVK